MTNRVIRVQGKGRATQAPDKIIINFHIAQKDEKYEVAVSGCNNRTEGIRRSVASVGLDTRSLKTSSFDVENVYEYINDRSVHVGYEAIHSTTLEFAFDKVLVSRLMNSITVGGYKPKLSTVFTIHDHETLRCRVLEDAVRNSTRRAEAIAKTAGLSLGPIELMEHEAIGIPSSTTCYREPQNFFSMKEKSHDTSWTIEPKELVAEASVLVAWQLIE